MRTVGGPERGIFGTANCLTIIFLCSETADITASPRPPSLKNEKHD